MKILGIETSCDETAVAVLEIKNNEVKVLTNTISYQIKLHAKYGGIVPNLAAREHVKNIGHVFKLALGEAGIWRHRMSAGHPMSKIDLIAVTRGPGLGPALLVGITFAKTLAWKYKKPLVGVNHLEGHIYSNFLKKVGVKSTLRSLSEVGPILNLIVSGGHTELVLMRGHGKYKIIGETLDDAVGEAFDKVARLLGLGYPGGPIISKIAEDGNPDRYPLPSPMLNSKNYNFSYSGLKTAVLYLLRDLEAKSYKLKADDKLDIAASFQKAAVDVLIQKTIKAAKEYKTKSIFLSGGVSANKHLRTELEKAAQELKLNYSQPELEYTGDNAAMIALAGYFNYKYGKKTGFSWKSVEMDANLGFRN